MSSNGHATEDYKGNILGRSCLRKELYQIWLLSFAKLNLQRNLMLSIAKLRISFGMVQRLFILDTLINRLILEQMHIGDSSL